MPNPKPLLVTRLTPLFGERAAQQISDCIVIIVFAAFYYAIAIWSLQLAFAKTNATPIGWPRM